jgi:hypothetical protein
VRNESKDKTLCGIQLTSRWERDVVGIDPTRIQCKRCKAILAKNGRATARFRLGALVATRGALDALTEAEENPATYLRRHLAGDWGDLTEEDVEANEWGVENEGRLLSAYNLSDGTRIWIITEWDRSVTTILLPGEY